MSVTDAQLLDMHKRALETIRAAIDGLDADVLAWREPDTGKSVAGEVRHLCNAERYWLREAGLDPEFSSPPASPASVDDVLECLSQAEARWAELLPTTPELRMSLYRVCLHALYHLPRVVHFRKRRQPDWAMPHWSKPGSWEHGVEPMLHAMLAERPDDVDVPPTPGFEPGKLE